MRSKHRKMFSIENIFRENDFSENIFRRKPFYVEVNEALISFCIVNGTSKWYFHSTFVQTSMETHVNAFQNPTCVLISH